jgi:uncharacterized protein (TIGR02246 family)
MTGSPAEEDVRREIGQRWADYVQAAKNKDPEALVTIWTPDMRLLSDPGGAEDIRSAEEHRALAETAFTALTVEGLTVDTDEVTLISASSAVEIGHWSEEVTIEGREGRQRLYGAYMGLWERQPDGRWLLRRFIRNRHDFANPVFEETLKR